MQREFHVQNQSMDDCCIEYRIYIQKNLPQDSEEYDDCFHSVLVEYTAFLSQIIGDYIWQNESFNLKLAPKNGKEFNISCLTLKFSKYIANTIPPFLICVRSWILCCSLRKQITLHVNCKRNSECFFKMSHVLYVGNEVPACLWGQTNCGDNVEDEWFIVFLLFQLSSQYPEITIR